MLKYLLLILPLFITANLSFANDALFDKLIKQEMDKANIPGLAVSVGKNGRLIFSKGYGFANITTKKSVTTDTTFHIASITKTITATAIIQLVEQGKLALDAPINRYIDFSITNPHYPKEHITVRHLLNHTSSISDKMAYEIDFRVKGRDSEIELEQLVKGYLLTEGEFYTANKNFLDVKPGTRWSYSNIGYALLGYIVEQIGEYDLRSFSAKHIFNPLQMHQTYWRIADTPVENTASPYVLVNNQLTKVAPVGFADWPAGMLRSTVKDINIFATATANSGRYNNVSILKPEAVLEMLNTKAIEGLPAWSPRQGLGWGETMLNGQSTISHWGGDPGVFTATYINPKTTTAVTILMNTSANKDTIGSLKAIASALFNMVEADNS
ncbi:MAG: serine hydrolase domain-containing protein [Cognaticolwellia sp.]